MVTEGSNTVNNVSPPVTGAEGTTEGWETYTPEPWTTAPHTRWGVDKEEYERLIKIGAEKNAWGAVMKTQEEYDASWGIEPLPASEAEVLTQTNQEATTTPTVAVLTDALGNVAIVDGTPTGTNAI